MTNLEDKTDIEELVYINKLFNSKSNPVAVLDEDQTSVGNLEDGYYLIKDVDKSLDGKTDEAYTLYITKVIGNLTIKPKTGIPTVDKDVYDNEDPAIQDGESINQAEGWYETADHDLNTVFQFRLTGSVDASTLAKYEKYQMIFHDTLSKGIEYKDGLKVYVNGNKEAISDELYQVSDVEIKDDGTKTFSITFLDVNTADFKDNSGDVKIEIIYNAVLTEDAVLNDINSTKIGNTNNVYLEYSNNPNSTGTGITKDDDVFVAAFKLTNTKKALSEEGDPLAGAGFELWKEDGQKVAVFKKTAIKNENNETITVAVFQRWADKPISDAGDDITTTITSDSDGDFSMYGLDAGTYTLKEVVTPDGYNTASPATVTIKATHKEDNGGKTATVTIDKGSTSTTVVNTQNGTLPETGGMGTTMIYGAGALMVAGAAVVFVTNKRTRKN